MIYKLAVISRQLILGQSCPHRNLFHGVKIGREKKSKKADVKTELKHQSEGQKQQLKLFQCSGS